MAGVPPAVAGLQPTRLPQQGSRQTQFDRSVFVIRFSVSGLVREKFSVPRGRARSQRPDSIVHRSARCPGSILILPESTRANPAPAKDRRSFAGVAAIPRHHAKAAESMCAVFGRPSMSPSDQERKGGSHLARRATRPVQGWLVWRSRAGRNPRVHHSVKR